VLGPFIGAERDRNGRAFTGIEEGELTEGRNGLRRGFRSREEDDLTGGSGLLVGSMRQ
jgi:hypothetical protein